ncbi:hypothetical protein MTR67_002562 [Solanum verrucosum]|uniref:Uncharacterized protein n=1 Tax=Solanum verrucosum TaxID=315347 RepID=A0AAF0PQT7_SOLVR|nr:hypothetical protein MTR67_002562 [Solanum verrucosum]
MLTYCTFGRRSDYAEAVMSFWEKQMDDLAEVYPELNVPGSAPNDVYSQAEKRDFDTRVEMEVQKATSAMKIEMTKKMYEAKKEMEVMDKKFLEVKEEAKENNEVMERKLSEAKMDLEEIIADKVKFLIILLKIVNNHHHLVQVFTQERLQKISLKF